VDDGAAHRSRFSQQTRGLSYLVLVERAARAPNHMLRNLRRPRLIAARSLERLADVVLFKLRQVRLEIYDFAGSHFGSGDDPQM